MLLHTMLMFQSFFNFEFKHSGSFYLCEKAELIALSTSGGGHKNWRTDVQLDGKSPHQHDYVIYRGRCPKSHSDRPCWLVIALRLLCLSPKRGSSYQLQTVRAAIKLVLRWSSCWMCWEISRLFHCSSQSTKSKSKSVLSNVLKI